MKSMDAMSKSRFVKFCQCPKALWLQVNKPEEAVIDELTKDRLRNGNVVGDLAMGLLGDFVEVTAVDEKGNLDLAEMMRKTQECMANGIENIAEASFSFNGNYCAVDILHRMADGWSIYEVKSSRHTDNKKAMEKKFCHYAKDIAYQKWVLTQCGVNVTGTFLIQPDSEYVLEGELDIHKFYWKRRSRETLGSDLCLTPDNFLFLTL